MTTIERVQVLQGHTSPETAYNVDDYPYSFTLRCRIRYWVDTATNSQKRNMQRFRYQTTNPKRAGEPWNNPKSSTYGLLTVMYLDSDNHVQHTGVSELGVTPESDAWFRLRDIYRQLTDEQRDRYDWLLDRSRRYRKQWESFEEKITALAAHLAATGTDPHVDNGIWPDPNSHTHYLGTDHVPMYLALAQQRLTGTDA